jgi:hypothetical protein
MRRLVKRSFLVWACLLGACSGADEPRGAARVDPSVAPIAPPKDEAPPPRHWIVAWINGRPVTRDDILDATLQMDYEGTVSRYAARVLVQQRKQELGIVNTPDQLRRRARVYVDQLKASAGAPAFDEQLRRSGTSEEDFVDFWARQAALEALLGNEKATLYELISGGCTRVDLAILASIQEADAYERDPSSVKPRELLRGVRISPSIYPSSLRRDLVNQICAADPSDPDRRSVRAGMARGPGAAHVTIREQIPAVRQDYASMEPRLMEEILRRPPDAHEVELWIESLLRGAQIKLDDDLRARGR